MRRALVAVMVAVVLTQALIAEATSSANIKDRFDSIGWAGSNGSLPWSGPWVELGDDGDEKKGSVRVVASGNCADANCMRISGLLAGIGAGRSADASQLEELRLSYDLNNVVTLLPLGLSELQVQVSVDGSWTTVATYDLGDDFSGSYTHELSDEFQSGAIQVRFRVTGAAMTSEVFVDNVELEGELEEESTTTTSPTTTTTEGTTTTTDGTTTTTTDGTTTTTEAHVETTTTTRPRATTTIDAPATTTTHASTTTSSIALLEDRDDNALVSPASSTTTTVDDRAANADLSGIRAAANGLQASFQGDLYGEVRTVASPNSVDLQADYNMAVEVIKSTWAWMVLLGLVVAWAILTGLDRRKGRLEV